MKGIAGEGQGNEQEWRQSARGTRECQRNVWERVQSARGMLENAGKCQGNIWEWVQTARGMQGNVRQWVQCQGNAEECRGIQGNARETYGSECKLLGECRECWGRRGMPGIRMGVGVECQRNAGDYQGNAREWV